MQEERNPESQTAKDGSTLENSIAFVRNFPLNSLSSLHEGGGSLAEKIEAMQGALASITSALSTLQQDSPKDFKNLEKVMGEMKTALKGVRNLPTVGWLRKKNAVQKHRKVQGDVEQALDNAFLLLDSVSNFLEQSKKFQTQLGELNSLKGVDRQSNHFKKEAGDYECGSYWWGGATMVVAFALLLYIFGLSDRLNTTPSFNREVWTPEISFGVLRWATVQALAVSVFLFAMLFCARNFMAERHNVVINRHRRAILLSYRSLVKASRNPRAEDVILVQMTQSIYAPMISGYIKSGGTDGGGASIVREIVGQAAKTVEKADARSSAP